MLAVATYNGTVLLAAGFDIAMQIDSFLSSYNAHGIHLGTEDLAADSSTSTRAPPDLSDLMCSTSAAGGGRRARHIMDLEVQSKTPNTWRMQGTQGF